MLIYVKAGTGFTDEILATSTIEVKVNNVKTTAHIDLSTGQATAVGEAKSVTAFNAGEYYRALIVPQTVEEDTDLITVTVNGVDYILTKGFTFKANKQYTFTVTLNNANNGITLSINDWNVETGDFGGIMTQQYGKEATICAIFLTN